MLGSPLTGGVREGAFGKGKSWKKRAATAGSMERDSHGGPVPAMLVQRGGGGWRLGLLSEARPRERPGVGCTKIAHGC